MYSVIRLNYRIPNTVQKIPLSFLDNLALSIVAFSLVAILEKKKKSFITVQYFNILLLGDTSFIFFTSEVCILFVTVSWLKVIQIPRTWPYPDYIYLATSTIDFYLLLAQPTLYASKYTSVESQLSTYLTSYLSPQR